MNNEHDFREHTHTEENDYQTYSNPQEDNNTVRYKLNNTLNNLFSGGKEETIQKYDSTCAIVSLVLGIISIIFSIHIYVSFPSALIGAFLGYIYRNTESRKIAIAGLIVSIIGLLIIIRLIVFANSIANLFS